MRSDLPQDSPLECLIANAATEAQILLRPALGSIAGVLKKVSPDVRTIEPGLNKSGFILIAATEKDAVAAAYPEPPELIRLPPNVDPDLHITWKAIHTGICTAIAKDRSCGPVTALLLTKMQSGMAASKAGLARIWAEGGIPVVVAMVALDGARDAVGVVGVMSLPQTQVSVH
jgi:hypothetical protein